MQSALARRSYSEPTPVQAAVLGAEERDLLVSAQTGSGKTVAFGLAVARTLLGESPRFTPGGAPLALVITPTRELALQVHRELAWLFADTGARITTCVGGMDPRRESHALAQGVHVVVGTPGRLCDHLERGSLALTRLGVVVLDEADEMLDMGFREDLERILEAAPTTRRTLMFSATIPKDIATLAKRYQRDAMRIAATSEGDRHRDIEYQAIPIVPRERDLAVVNLLRYHEAAGALVFCATRDGVTHLAANLNERGFAVAALSGELSQRERNTALQALRDGRARVCVATDVAARGLDLPDLGLVIHADLPQNKQVLVHRSGRTGRAGHRGTAILLVPDPARRYVERMLHAAHVEAKWLPPPTADEILARDQSALGREIGSLIEDVGDDDRQLARTLLAEHAAEDLVATLVRARRQARPAPELLTPPPSMRPRPAPAPRAPAPPRRPAAPPPARAAHAPAPAPATPATPAVADERPLNARERRMQRRALERGEPPPPRVERPSERIAETGPVWFTINVGRSKNADPKWIVPLLCRRGGISKRDIGKIQILARETRVEIAPGVSDRFAEAVRHPDPKDRNIHIEPLA
ncbi:MAG TPA: DEAD/DEAH box helicase [Kofleriaceae bacterium]|nr:DEAD/DEAH box helicase [Kofleriaceae bacterium]